MVDPEGRNLIFILSTPRAGSTLLGSMLGSHTQVLCPSEPWLLLPLNALRADAAAIVAGYDHELARLAWRQWIDDDLFRQAAGRFALTVYNNLLAAAGKHVFVDKTPRYYHILPWLDSLFPCALKIWLRRNPLDVLASCKDTWAFTIEELVGLVVSPQSFDNTISFSLLASYFVSRAPTRYSLRYEDLVREPRAHLQALCEFAGLPFEDRMLNYGENSDLVRMLSEKTMGDKKILEHTYPHSSSVGRWREVLTKPELRQVLFTLGTHVFEGMGYADVLEEAARYVDLNPAHISRRGRLDRMLESYADYVEQSLLTVGSAQQTRIARENARLRARVAKTAQLQEVLQAIANGRVYKLVRALGRWKWVEQALNDMHQRGS